MFKYRFKLFIATIFFFFSFLISNTFADNIFVKNVDIIVNGQSLKKFEILNGYSMVITPFDLVNFEVILDIKYQSLNGENVFMYLYKFDEKTKDMKLISYKKIKGKKYKSKNPKEYFFKGKTSLGEGYYMFKVIVGGSAEIYGKPYVRVTDNYKYFFEVKDASFKGKKIYKNYFVGTGKNKGYFANNWYELFDEIRYIDMNNNKRLDTNDVLIPYIEKIVSALHYDYFLSKEKEALLTYYIRPVVFVESGKNIIYLKSKSLENWNKYFYKKVVKDDLTDIKMFNAAFYKIIMYGSLPSIPLKPNNLERIGKSKLVLGINNKMYLVTAISSNFKWSDSNRINLKIRPVKKDFTSKTILYANIIKKFGGDNNTNNKFQGSDILKYTNTNMRDFIKKYPFEKASSDNSKKYSYDSSLFKKQKFITGVIGYGDDKSTKATTFHTYNDYYINWKLKELNDAFYSLYTANLKAINDAIDKLNNKYKNATNNYEKYKYGSMLDKIKTIKKEFINRYSIIEKINQTLSNK